MVPPSAEWLLYHHHDIPEWVSHFGQKSRRDTGPRAQCCSMLGRCLESYAATEGSTCFLLCVPLRSVALKCICALKSMQSCKLLANHESAAGLMPAFSG